MKEILGEEWFEVIGGEFGKDYMKKLQQFVISKRQQGIVYPESGDVFNAFKYTPYSQVKVCILGQD